VASVPSATGRTCRGELAFFLVRDRDGRATLPSAADSCSVERTARRERPIHLGALAVGQCFTAFVVGEAVSFRWEGNALPDPQLGGGEWGNFVVRRHLIITKAI